MLLDFRAQFKATIPICEGFFDLMKKTFGFYTSLCNDFLSSLGSEIENHTLDAFLKEEIRPRLFDPEYCKHIEAVKRQFLAENIKLEQFIEEQKYTKNFLNDLKLLRKVSDAIYDLLQKHWELYKYEKSIVGNRMLVSFLLDIDRVGIGWDAYLEKYLAVSRILTIQSQRFQKPGYSSVEVRYHLPDEADLTITMGSDFISFLQLAFEIVLTIHNCDVHAFQVGILSLDSARPITCILSVPDSLTESYKRLLNYLSVDILKRDTLVKFVLEVLRLQQDTEISKAALVPMQKRLAKKLNQLHPEGYFSVNQDRDEDSVNILSTLCQEMEQLEIDFKNLLTGSNNRLARNRLPSVPVALPKETRSPAEGERQKSPEPTAESEGKESTMKIDVKNKEHIRFLTS